MLRRCWCGVGLLITIVLALWYLFCIVWSRIWNAESRYTLYLQSRLCCRGIRNRNTDHFAFYLGCDAHNCQASYQPLASHSCHNGRARHYSMTITLQNMHDKQNVHSYLANFQVLLNCTLCSLQRPAAHPSWLLSCLLSSFFQISKHQHESIEATGYLVFNPIWGLKKEYLGKNTSF